VGVGGNILHIAQRRKADWVDDGLCRYCVPKHIIEGKIERRICYGKAREKT